MYGAATVSWYWVCVGHNLFRFICGGFVVAKNRVLWPTKLALESKTVDDSRLWFDSLVCTDSLFLGSYPIFLVLFRLECFYHFTQ